MATGPAKQKLFGAAHVKAHFLALANEVAVKRRPLLVTKNGKPFVRVVPCEPDEDLLAAFHIGGRIVGDLDAAVSDPEDWEYD